MGKHKFDRKKAVRFHLVPGPEKDGKPTVLFRPAENKRSKVSRKEKKKVIAELADYDEIKINGRVVEEDEIPAYVLEQIRGRKDLVYNQMRGEEEEEGEGDLYELQDGVEDEDMEEYDEEEEDEEGIKEEVEKEEYDDSEEEWEDDGDSDD
jgi:hypothetical protein